MLELAISLGAVLTGIVTGVETFKDHASLGRFTIRDEGKTVGEYRQGLSPAKTS